MSSSSPAPKRPPSAAGRYLFLFLIGLALGVVATVMLMRAIQSRVDPFPRAVMHVKQWHSAQLRARLEENRCTASDVVPQLQALRVVADDLEPAFPGLAEDRRFREHASDMRGALDTALASPPTNCDALREVSKRVGESCRACHLDFRS